jgi:hypothetical protein
MKNLGAISSVSSAARLPWMAMLLFIQLIPLGSYTTAQTIRGERSGSHPSRSRETMSAEDREILDRAIDVVCLERKRDSQGSATIDDMQGRPSLPVNSPEAIAGGRRAQRLLPAAKSLVIKALSQLAIDFGFRNFVRGSDPRLRRAVARVEAVRRVKSDMDSRDNASVFLRNPHTITFGTIFLVGLPSDEGMLSVLAHELVHIADGDRDDLRPLFAAIARHAGDLASLKILDQRAEELTCDLVGAITSRAFVSVSPNYEPLARRIARSIEHNCVEEDEGDEDHLSPRNTIRALLAIRPSLSRELVYGREEKPGRPLY